ncbi:MAG: hypothetical protein AAFX95_16815 [Cyanobacteria bacterium J06639_16]
MSTQETARQNIAQQRQHQKHQTQSMLERTEAESAGINDVEIQEETREALTRGRQKEQHTVQSMQRRLIDEVEGSKELGDPN